MKNKLIKISLSLFIMAAIVGFGSKVYAFSGLLDTYSGTYFSITGGTSVDSFTTYGHVYLEHWNDNDDAKNYGVEIALYKKTIWGGSYVDQTTVYGDYSQPVFALPESATYYFFFRCPVKDHYANFHGNVFDYK